MFKDKLMTLIHTIPYMLLPMTHDSSPQLQLYNSLTRQKEPLHPEKDGVGMYVCGPTVYSRPHIGNARSVVIYDVLFRVLKHLYREKTVTYVRNITDVDDKINAAAMTRGISIGTLTQEVTDQFHEDVNALHCLSPTVEPKATEHISQIIAMVSRLVEGGYAYVAGGHVLFDVTSPSPEQSIWQYGMLSGRKIEDQEAGARVAVESYKRHAGDFVLWKPTDAEDDVSSTFDSPWGAGRPGWHIECSAMSTHYLGETFDIHGGGADLKFPHHENEIAQSCCANVGSDYAKLWMHNGFLTVDGTKMSKSLGNIVTVRNLLDDGLKGEVIRFALLSTHYGKPLDWTDKLMTDAAKQLEKLYRRISSTQQQPYIPADFIQVLSDDMNVPAAIAWLHQADNQYLQACGALLGLLQDEAQHWQPHIRQDSTLSDEDINNMVQLRTQAKQAKDWAEADRLRDTLHDAGVTLVDKSGGVTEWHR